MPKERITYTEQETPYQSPITGTCPECGLTLSDTGGSIGVCGRRISTHHSDCANDLAPHEKPAHDQLAD